MKIATFNVNGIRTRLPHLLRWLAREQPDVACLQELKALDESFPAQELQAAGYHALWKGQRSWNGVAILARGVAPVEIRRALPGDADDAQSRYLEAAIDGVVGEPGTVLRVRLNAATIATGALEFEHADSDAAGSP